MKDTSSIQCHLPYFIHVYQPYDGILLQTMQLDGIEQDTLLPRIEFVLKVEFDACADVKFQ